MGKVKNTSFFCIITGLLIFSMVYTQIIANNSELKQSNEDIIGDLSDSSKNIEDTFSFIMKRLMAIRNSKDFQVTESLTPESSNLHASDGDETVNIDESYEVKNIINPHPTNQTSTTQTMSPLNQTNVTIIMGFTYQLIKYNWEISWELELFGFKIAYAYFGIEIDIGAGMRFPINISVDYPTEVSVGQLTSVNLTLQTLDLPNYNETYFHFVARIYAGISAFGLDGEWGIGPNYREDRSYETPLGPANLVDLGEISIPILEILGQLNIPTISQIAGIIAQWVADILIKLRFSVGSDLLTMQAKIFGNDTHFNSDTGPSSMILNFTQSDTENLFIYAKNPGSLRLELSDFKYYLNKLEITILLGLSWKTVFSYLFDDREWEIYSFTIPLGNLIVFESANTATVEMNTTLNPPVEVYGVDMVYISSMETIELGKDIAEYFIVLDNTGQNIEHDIYDIEITGIDPSWVIHPPYLTIKQGSSGYFTLKIDPPRESSSSAGIHPFTVTAISRGDPTENDSIIGTLNIMAYYESKVERTSLFDWGIINITPEIPANVSFSITNTGNKAENFSLSMETEGLNSSIFEVPSIVTLVPGESINIHPNITVPKSPDFPALRYSVQLLSQSEKNPLATAHDTVQMNILPYKNLSISITERSIPSRILPGSILSYDIHIENNGNFNDTIQLLIAGLSPDFYDFTVEDPILFPGHVLDTTLTITIPPSSMRGETLDLKFVAQFTSNQTIQIEDAFLIQTASNYLPLVLTIIIIGVIAASSPMIYKQGIQKRLVPYVKRKRDARVLKKSRKRDARVLKKYQKRPDEMKIRINNCIFCFKKLTDGEIHALESDSLTMCEGCGKILRPEFLEISVPKQKSIDQVVTEKMEQERAIEREKEEQAKQKQLDKEKKKQEKVKAKILTEERIKQYKKKLADTKSPIPIDTCPFCFKKLSPTDVTLLKKNEMTFCPHCKKILDPKYFQK